jgi:BirA family biotin operon repressor/biotin-[acetyl-CoA-carboxylase] ligase
MTMPGSVLTLTRRAAIAAALRAAGTAGISGEALGRTLGISRVAVGKHVAVLRELGYAIESVPHVGYRLRSAPDACIPEEVCPRLRDPLWVRCEGGAKTASTNEDAKRLARDGALEGSVVVAARQAGGRGRFGRVWESPAGGVYVSCVLRPDVTPSALSPLGLVVGVGVARGLESLGVPVGLKWPNDVLAGGRKIAGILLEAAAEADRVEWVVVGCGINVAPVPAAGAAWVREAAPDARVAEVAAAALDGIARAYREFRGSGLGGILAEYRSRSVLTGRQVTVRDARGSEVTTGTVETIDDDGALVLAGAAGPIRVVAGEVTLRRPDVDAPGRGSL